MHTDTQDQTQGEKQPLTIRAATAADVDGAEQLLYSAGPELYDFVYMAPSTPSTDFIRFEFKSGRGFCGYRNVTVAEQGGRVVGTGCFFDGAQYKSLTLGTLRNMFKFYGVFKVWPVLIRSLNVASVMHEPAKNELYLSNFGVHPEARSTGIGSALINSQLQSARAKRYATFILDVSDRNPRAQALYERLGLVVTKHKHFTGRRKGIDVPNCRQMELPLAGLPASRND